jgi:hypothetical protein
VVAAPAPAASGGGYKGSGPAIEQAGLLPVVRVEGLGPAEQKYRSMGVYDRVEGKLCNGRGVWRARDRSGGDNFVFYARRQHPQDDRWHWWIGSMTQMNSERGGGHFKISSEALIPTNAVDDMNMWTCAPGDGNWYNVPRVRVNPCISMWNYRMVSDVKITARQTPSTDGVKTGTTIAAGAWFKVVERRCVSLHTHPLPPSAHPCPPCPPLCTALSPLPPSAHPCPPCPPLHSPLPRAPLCTSLSPLPPSVHSPLLPPLVITTRPTSKTIRCF